MKISLLTYGSRGDVQPYLALAFALRKAGHVPSLAAPGRFAGMIAEHDLPFIPLAGDPVEISRQLNEAGQAPLRMVRSMQGYVNGMAGEVAQQAWQGCQGADLIVHTQTPARGSTRQTQMAVPGCARAEGDSIVIWMESQRFASSARVVK